MKWSARLALKLLLMSINASRMFSRQVIEGREGEGLYAVAMDTI
jgi:hypothetical protein